VSVRHSHQDAVDERTFEELLEATHHLTEPFDIQCRFVLVAAGRLGMIAAFMFPKRGVSLRRLRATTRTTPYELALPDEGA